MASSPLMQRRNVLLPEPLRPMMAMTSPSATTRLIPRSTTSEPKLLRRSLTAISDIELPFENLASLGQWPAKHEIEQGREGIYRERLEGRVDDHRAGLHQFDEADDGS